MSSGKRTEIKKMLDLLTMAAILSGEIDIAGMLSLTDIVCRLPEQKRYEFSKVAHDWLKANSEDFEKFSIEFDAKIGKPSEDVPTDVPRSIADFLSKLH